MKRLVPVALLILLALTFTPVQLQAKGATSSLVYVDSVYTLNRYGYATVNETVTFTNNSTSPASPPAIEVGLGNVSTFAVASMIFGEGFQMSSNATGGPFLVTSTGSTAAGGNSSFTISVLLNGIVTFGANGTLYVVTLTAPSMSLLVKEMTESVKLPSSASFTSAPTGLGSAVNGTYSATVRNAKPASAVFSVDDMPASDSTGFHPLKIFSAERKITIGAGDVPMVTDSVTFENMGSTGLETLALAALTSSDGKVTVVPPGETRLIAPVTVALSNGSLSLSSLSFGAVAPDSNYTIAYQYPLAKAYYSVSGGQVTLKLPDSPSIPAFIEHYSVVVSVPPGLEVVGTPSFDLSNVSPWQSGTSDLAYRLTVGWAVDGGIPGGLLAFALLFVALFASRGSLSTEEEEDEETSTDVAEATIKAFDEKTNLINGLWSEVAEKEAGELSKAYFDAQRAKLDDFRGKAIRRLNELRQKSTTQKFFDLLAQVTETEREVDRAAKDKLNLYEQYYTKRMRKEVFDRLSPQYTKRLERALNQLSDELHTIQKEAKLL